MRDDIGQKVDDENQYRLHSREDQRIGGAGRKIVYWPDFRTELAIRDPHVAGEPNIKKFREKAPAEAPY